MIFIDSREDPKIVRIAERLKIDFTIKALPVGDFLCEEKNIVFERKTVMDFANSIRSGHLQKQLLQQEQFNYSYLIIVGKFGDLFFSGLKNFTIEHWLGSIASCAVRFNVKLLFVDNDTQALKLIMKIIEKTDDGKEVTIRDTELLKNKLSVDDIKIKLLCCFDKVGRKKAEKLLLNSIINSKLDDLIVLFKK